MNIQKRLKKQAMIAAAVAVVAGSSAAGGFGGSRAYATTMPDYNNSMPADMHSAHSQAATDLRVTMNNLLREHVTASLNVTRNIVDHGYDNRTDAAMGAQYANSDALSDAVGSVYGDAARTQFSGLFREHIVKSNQYALAVANGDESARQAANQELQEYLHEIAAFFSGAIPGLQAQDVYGLLNEHEELINKSTEAYYKGDFAASYALEREALKQISMAADALSGGIISTQPAKFQ